MPLVRACYFGCRGVHPTTPTLFSPLIGLHTLSSAIHIPQSPYPIFLGSTQPQRPLPIKTTHHTPKLHSAFYQPPRSKPIKFLTPSLLFQVFYTLQCMACVTRPSGCSPYCHPPEKYRKGSLFTIPLVLPLRSSSLPLSTLLPPVKYLYRLIYIRLISRPLSQPPNPHMSSSLPYRPPEATDNSFPTVDSFYTTPFMPVPHPPK